MVWEYDFCSGCEKSWVHIPGQPCERREHYFTITAESEIVCDVKGLWEAHDRYRDGPRKVGNVAVFPRLEARRKIRRSTPVVSSKKSSPDRARLAETSGTKIHNLGLGPGAGGQTHQFITFLLVFSLEGRERLSRAGVTYVVRDGQEKEIEEVWVQTVVKDVLHHFTAVPHFSFFLQCPICGRSNPEELVEKRVGLLSCAGVDVAVRVPIKTEFARLIAKAISLPPQKRRRLTRRSRCFFC